MEARYWEQKSPVGVVRIRTGPGGVERVTLDDEDDLVGGTAPEAVVADAFERYFDGEIGALDELPVDVEGTPFRSAVWAELRRIPVGTTVTYGQLAQRLGRSMRASRAVGGAVGSNPAPFVIPCHRVIGADGSLTGFGLGLDVKRHLLVLEGVLLYS